MILCREKIRIRGRLDSSNLEGANTDRTLVTASRTSVALAAQVTARHLKQAIGAIVCYRFFCYASRTADLLTVFAVEEIFEGV